MDFLYKTPQLLKMNLVDTHRSITKGTNKEVLFKKCHYPFDLMQVQLKTL